MASTGGGEGGALSSAGTTTIGSNCTTDQLLLEGDLLLSTSNNHNTRVKNPEAAPSTCALLEALNQSRVDNQAFDLLLRQFVCKQKDALDSMLLNITQLLKNQTAVIDSACECLNNTTAGGAGGGEIVEGVQAQLSPSAVCAASCTGRPDLNATSLRLFRAALQRQQQMMRPRPLIGSPVITNSPPMRARLLAAATRRPQKLLEECAMTTTSPPAAAAVNNNNDQLSPLVRNLLSSSASWKKTLDRAFEPLDPVMESPSPQPSIDAAATLAAIVSREESSSSYAERLVQSIFPSALLLNSVVDDLPSPPPTTTTATATAVTNDASMATNALVHLVAPPTTATGSAAAATATMPQRIEPLVRQIMTVEMAKRVSTDHPNSPLPKNRHPNR